MPRVGVLSAVFLIVGAFFQGEEILTLASIYSFGILIALFLAQVSIIWLRIMEPEMPRPFMMRGNVRIRGRLVPVTAAVGAVAAFAAWIIALGTHPGARDVGVLWMAGGIAIYAAIRVRAGQPMLERVEPTAPPPEEWLATPSGPIVVPLERNDAIGEEMMATAMRLAAENNSPVVGVSAIMIPVREPIDSPRPEREQEVEEVQRAAAGARPRVPRAVHAGGRAHPQPGAHDRRCGGGARSRTDRDRRAGQAAAGEEP